MRSGVHPRIAGFGLAVAVLVVSLCAARCAAEAARMPCHGEASDAPCAALSSQNWVASPDITAALLAAVLLLAVLLGFLPPLAGELALGRTSLNSVRALVPRPPPRRASFSPRAPPRGL